MFFTKKIFVGRASPPNPLAGIYGVGGGGGGGGPERLFCNI
jgi:hypothetical protein